MPSSVLQVHCVRAYGKLLEAIQQLGPFPAGLVLHSFAGPAEMVTPFAKVICLSRPGTHCAATRMQHDSLPFDFMLRMHSAG
jgi:TatD DNase family protein